MSNGLYCPWFYIQLRDNNGDNLSNGLMYTFENKSTIPKPVWSDVDLQYPLANPVPLDSAGVVPRFFLTSGTYTITFKDRYGNVLATADDIIGLGGEGETSAYSLPIASSSTLGGVKINGNGLAIDGNGTLSVLPTSAQTISLSGYAALSGASFTGPVTSPTFSANSISANSFETSSVKISDINGGLKIENKSGSYDVRVNFGPENSNQFIKTESGQMRIGGENAYASFDGANFYITSGNLIVGDDPATIGTKSLINNQQLTQNYRATFNSSAVVFDKFKSKQLITDSTGQLSGIETGSVMYDTGDSPRPLKYKIKSGSGIVITTATDGSNGVVMSINARGNNWTLVKNVTAATYTVTDSDSTLINLNTNSIITLPTASSLYDGRIVTVRGGLLGSTTTVNSLSTIVGTPSVVITNYDKRDFLCYFNSVQWQWVITN